MRKSLENIIEAKSAVTERIINNGDAVRHFIRMIARMTPSTDAEDAIATVDNLIREARKLSKKLEG